MVSKLKQFIALLLVGFSSLLLANTTPKEPIPVSPAITVEDICNLGAPAFFNVMDVGTTWAQVAWAPVAGAFQYHIVTREFPSGNLLNDMYISAAFNSATITPLPPGTMCRSEIWAVCQNGQDGTTSRLSPTYGTPIIDMVDCAIWGTENLSEDDCIMGTNYSIECDIPNGIEATAFRISNVANDPSSYRYFKVYKEGNVLKVALNAITNGNIKYELVGIGGAYIVVKVNTVPAGSFSTNNPTANSPKKLFFTNDVPYNGTFFMRKMDGDVSSCVPERNSDENENWETINIEPQHLTASPNPFTNLLDVQIPFATEENDVKMSLYDLQGRLILSIKTPGGAQIRTLSTEDLAPGLYILRVDTGDKSETIKVMKTQ